MSTDWIRVLLLFSGTLALSTSIAGLYSTQHDTGKTDALEAFINVWCGAGICAAVVLYVVAIFGTEE